MKELVPDHMNESRRKLVIRNTLITLLTYHCPVIAGYLAKYLNLVRYDYTIVHYFYLTIILVTLAYIFMIRLKKQVSRTFVWIVMSIQIFVWYIMMIVSLFFLGDLRIIVLISSLLALIFVFGMSSFRLSVFMVGAVILNYLSVSYIAIYYLGHAGSFEKEVLYVVVYTPTAIFIAYKSSLVKIKNTVIKNSRDELHSTYQLLETTHSDMEEYNNRLVESLNYAELIQRSLLPGIDRLKSITPNSFFIWIPKDIVGGDIFYMHSGRDEAIVVLMDCTGHGVPGAFMTMIACTEVRKIIMDDWIREPADILQSLNKAVKKALQQGDGTRLSNNGLDASVCLINMKDNHIRFAGANMNLFYVKKGTAFVIKGDRKSLGYKDSQIDFTFTTSTIENAADYNFYMTTDGFIDQLGGANRRRFGTSRFKDLLVDIEEKAFEEQREAMMKTLADHQGENDRQDDIAVIGFTI